MLTTFHTEIPQTIFTIRLLFYTYLMYGLVVPFDSMGV